MNGEDKMEYLDEKNAFHAMVKDTFYHHQQIPEKQKKFADSYLKSFIHRSIFATETLRHF